MADKKPYEIVYNSDFIIDDPVELSTLCVFYDKVYLPGFLSASLERDVRESSQKSSKTVVERIISNISRWERDNRLFLDEDVIQRCETLDVDLLSLEEGLRGLMGDEELGFRLKRLFNAGEDLDESGVNQVDLRLLACLFHHYSRTDITLPRLSTKSQKLVNRETLKAFLANKAFRYVLPTLSDLQPDQILEVRRKVADLREGFSMHLQMLTADIDAQLKGGESAEEIGRYAQNVIETKFEPQYVEFERQLGSIKLRSAGKILDVVGRVFEVDASVLSPKFYLEVLKLGKLLVVGGAEELKDSLSNERQAYHFMRLVAGTEVGFK